MTKQGPFAPQKSNISGVITLQPKKCTNSDWILISWYYQPILQAILWGESLKITIHFHWFSTGAAGVTNHYQPQIPSFAAVLSAFGVNKGAVSVLCHFVHWWSFSHIIDGYPPQLGIFYRMFTYLSCIYIYINNIFICILVMKARKELQIDQESTMVKELNLCKRNGSCSNTVTVDVSTFRPCCQWNRPYSQHLPTSSACWEYEL